MKKISLIILLLFLAGGAFWFIWRDLNSGDVGAGEAIPAGDAENVSVFTDIASSSVGGQVSEVIQGSDKNSNDLEVKASGIIARPVIFKLQLSEREKQLALEKIEATKSLVKDNYDYLDAWLELGGYLQFIGDYDGAIEAWNFGSLVRPKNYVTFHNLGDLYGFYLKDYPKAEQNFLKSVDNSPSNIGAYLQLATLYEYSFQEKKDQVEPLLLLGIKFNPANPDLKIALGQYYQRIGKLSDALKYFEEALKLYPANKTLETDINELKSRLSR